LPSFFSYGFPVVSLSDFQRRSFLRIRDQKRGQNENPNHQEALDGFGRHVFKHERFHRLPSYGLKRFG
jgi:hypothetical protein